MKCDHCQNKIQSDGYICKECNTIIYCSKLCMERDYSEHKFFCESYKKEIQNNRTLKNESYIKDLKKKTGYYSMNYHEQNKNNSLFVKDPKEYFKRG